MHSFIKTFKPNVIRVSCNKSINSYDFSVLLSYGKFVRESFYKEGKRDSVEEYELIDEREIISDNLAFCKISTRKKSGFDVKKAKNIIFTRIHGDILEELNGNIMNAKRELEDFKNFKTRGKFFYLLKVKNFREINDKLKKTEFYHEFFTDYICRLSLLFGPKRDSLKSFTNNPISLSWKNIKNVSGSIYEKTDGERALLVVSNETYLVREGNIEFFSEYRGNAVYDCEYTGWVYIFDCICFDRNITNLDFINRREIILKSEPEQISPKILVKKVYDLRELEVVYKNSKNTDGIIINNNGPYWNPNYKWKPVEMQTIDFLVVPDNEVCWLMTGILRKKISWDLPKNHFELLKKYNIIPGEYIPIPFDKIDFSLNGSHKKCDLTFGISEFRWNEKWIFVRTRPDKSKLIGKSYGNDYFVAKSIVEIIKKPIEPSDITGGSQYFQQTKTDEFRAPIKFNSFVKFVALSGLAGFSSVLDIASGKGQDIFTYHGLGIKNVIFVEPDYDAFKELNKRLKSLGFYKFYIYTTIPRFKMEFKTLNRSYEKLEPQNCQAVVCNFALHYLLKKKEDYTKFAEFCKNSSRVILTFFNEKKLKLPITGKYNVFSGEDNTILVKHHFSDKPYQEWIINLNLLKKCFAQKGFKVSREHDFTDYLQEFSRADLSNYKKLTEEDKNYCGIYMFIEFRK